MLAETTTINNQGKSVMEFGMIANAVLYQVSSRSYRELRLLLYECKVAKVACLKTWKWMLLSSLMRSNPVVQFDGCTLLQGIKLWSKVNMRSIRGNCACRFLLVFFCFSSKKNGVSFLTEEELREEVKVVIL